MDSILIKEIDRIYRINKIYSRFPDETVKTTSACGGKRAVTPSQTVSQVKKCLASACHAGLDPASRNGTP